VIRRTRSKHGLSYLERGSEVKAERMVQGRFPSSQAEKL
jgi:hypothetical protein